MKKVYSVLLLLLVTIFSTVVPMANAESINGENIFSNFCKQGKKEYKRFEDASPEVKELIQKIKDNKTESSPKFKIKATVWDEKLKQDKELKLDTKYAVSKKMTLNADGTIAEDVVMLAATPLSATNSKTASGITQYNLLAWSQDSKYIKLTKQSSWWNRTSSTYSVKDAYMYDSAQGANKSTGYGTSCSDDWTIGTPSFYSNATGTYTLYPVCPYILYDPVVGGIGSFVRADIYSGSTKLYDNFRTSTTP